jgi:multisubunit Na+/H+ antiporter MnhB subunit
MNKAISIALLSVGLIFIVFGINASESFSSDVSRLFTGAPTDKAIWLFVGGAVALVSGLVMLFQQSKSLG